MANRKLFFRDSIAFVVFLAATIILYIVTSFLFRSFAERRTEIADRYASAGKAALTAGHPDQAITNLRVALSYAPDVRSNHLLLAEALAQTHHTEEANDYFLSLWNAQPADGFINLQLARLARQRDDRRDAINYYRASASGIWQDHSTTLRRQVQVELSDYLIESGDMAAARSELLIMAANVPETPQLDILLGDKLLQTADSNDAIIYYKKAVRLEPRNTTALYKAGSTSYSLGNYDGAHRLLMLALREQPEKTMSKPDAQNLLMLSQDAERMLQLTLSSELPAHKRAEHILTASSIAELRFDKCFTQLGTGVPEPDALTSLKQKWQSASKLIDRKPSLQNADDQDTLTQLIFDTEIQASHFCGSPKGDDALLLKLANTARPPQ